MKRRNSFALKYLLLLIVFPLSALAQDEAEMHDIPNPYNQKPYYDYIETSGVKEVATISRQKENNFKDDTTWVYSYNKSGQRVTSLRYVQNKIMSTTLMQYDFHNNQTQWSILEPNETVTTTRFYFNKFNKLDSTQQTAKRKDQVTHTSRFAYEYEKGRLMKKQIIMDGMMNRDESCTYSDTLLTEYKSIWSAEASYVSRYTYDKNNQLTEKLTTHYFTEKSELWNKKNFTYEKGKVVTEEELTYDNKHLMAHYYYDEKNRLQKIVSTFGDFQREIEFEYNEFDVEQVTVHTNSNSAYLKYYLPVRLDNVTYPIVYREKYTYDNKKNLVSKQNFVGDELIRESVYVVKYY